MYGDYTPLMPLKACLPKAALPLGATSPNFPATWGELNAMSDVAIDKLCKDFEWFIPPSSAKTRIPAKNSRHVVLMYYIAGYKSSPLSDN